MLVLVLVLVLVRWRASPCWRRVPVRRPCRTASLPSAGRPARRTARLRADPRPDGEVG
ncbi:hypothetical protein [Micromonospora humida]|uniref:Uncharacterized protein n=1 Tax=Micromonospora humida TaxID=2809018 RepID=A0ABS2ITQ4_9ACTN|nr:hypothetical protein [Micromonospora humida]MBM7077424.1 hypothetical protein [Micromonospora humida]